MILKAIACCSKHTRSKIFLSSSFLPSAAFAGKSDQADLFLFIENKKLGSVKSMYLKRPMLFSVVLFGSTPPLPSSFIGSLHRKNSTSEDKDSVTREKGLVYCVE
jgi:hypothetical protein